MMKEKHSPLPHLHWPELSHLAVPCFMGEWESSVVVCIGEKEVGLMNAYCHSYIASSTEYFTGGVVGKFPSGFW